MQARSCVRVLRELGNFLAAQPPEARQWRPGAMLITLGEILTACRDVEAIVNENFTDLEGGQ